MPKPKYAQRKGTTQASVSTRPRPKSTRRSTGFWKRYIQARIIVTALFFVIVGVAGIVNGITKPSLGFIFIGVVCIAFAVLLILIMRARR